MWASSDFPSVVALYAISAFLIVWWFTCSVVLSRGNSHSFVALFLVPFHSILLVVLLIIFTVSVSNSALYPASTTCAMDTKFFVKLGTMQAFVTVGGRLIGIFPSVVEVVVVLFGIIIVTFFALVVLITGVFVVIIVLVAPVSAIPMWGVGVLNEFGGQLKFLEFLIKFKFLYLFLIFCSKVLVSPESHNSTLSLFAPFSLPPLRSCAVASVLCPSSGHLHLQLVWLGFVLNPCVQQ